MKRKLGNILMILGVLLLAGALSLLLFNRHQQASAEQAAADILVQMQAVIRNASPEEPQTETLPPLSAAMTEVEIDGYGYIGYLSVPRLELELPIMSRLDYARLRIAPCRFTGTVMEDNLVLAAHNYRRHFGSFRSLTPGDQVIFTDMEGNSTLYWVMGLDILPPTAVEEVTDSGFDLTLFTCTYGGESRVVVFCNRVIQP